MTAPADPDALAIYQKTIDAISEHLLRGNFDGFKQHFTLPHVVTSLSNTLRIETEDELHANFRAFHESLVAQRVTDYIRLADWAVFETPTRIEGSHKTHIINNGRRIYPVYPNRVTLDLCDGQWLASSAVNAITNSTWPVSSLKVPENPALPTMEKADE